MMSALHVGGNGWCVGSLWPGWVFRPEYSVLALKWIPMSSPVSQVSSEPQLCPHASPGPPPNSRPNTTFKPPFYTYSLKFSSF